MTYIGTVLNAFCYSTGSNVFYSTGSQWRVLLLHRHTRGKSVIPPVDGRPVVIVFHSTGHSGKFTSKSNFTAEQPNPNPDRNSAGPPAAGGVKDISTGPVGVLDSGRFVGGVK